VWCVLHESSLHLFIALAWSVWCWKNRKLAYTAYACRHATAYAMWAQEAVVGCGRTLVGAPGHRPSLVGCWVGLGRVYTGVWTDE
jgi:hypothetical protein